MAATVFLSLTLLLSLHLSSSADQHQPSVPPIIHETCKASRDPSSCEAWLSGPRPVPPSATVPQVIHSALGITSQNLDKAQAILRDILHSSAGNVNLTTAVNYCLDLIHRAKYRLNLTDQALARKSLKDARAWLSAGLGQNYDCWSRLKYVNDTAVVRRAMEFVNSSLIDKSSSTLGMLTNYDIYGENTDSWGPPKTERDGFWEKAAASGPLGSSGGVPQGLKEKVTVCKSGCQFNTVQEAVNAAPNNIGDGKRFVIRIRAGVYKETVRIPLEKTNVVFLGDGMGKSVISGSRNAGQTGVSTYESATVGVDGDGFMASGITIENTATGYQAVAFRSDSDRSIIENCEFLGNQDTLYARALRQLYKSCRIQGNVDFIFGNAAAIFQDCTILVAPRPVNPEKGETNAVTAHGRTDPAQTTGFVFLNSVINGTDAYNDLYRKNPMVHRTFLGRPWKEFSRTVFIGSTLEALISTDGWLPWTGDFALKTLYYGEHKNTGAGSNIMKRVTWSSQIPEEHVGYYSVANFIQGNEWIVDSGKGSF